MLLSQFFIEKHSLKATATSCDTEDKNYHRWTRFDTVDIQSHKGSRELSFQTAYIFRSDWKCHWILFYQQLARSTPSSWWVGLIETNSIKESIDFLWRPTITVLFYLFSVWCRYQLRKIVFAFVTLRLWFLSWFFQHNTKMLFLNSYCFLSGRFFLLKKISLTIVLWAERRCFLFMKRLLKPSTTKSWTNPFFASLESSIVCNITLWYHWLFITSRLFLSLKIVH